MVALVGILTVLAGVLPFLSGLNFIPAAYTSGMIYSMIIIVIGVLGLIYGFVSNMLMGAQKALMILFAVLTILGGILPLIKGFVSIPIPTSGPIYSVIIIVIGAIAMVYGFKSF